MLRPLLVNVVGPCRVTVPAIAAGIAIGLLAIAPPIRGQGSISPALTILAKDGRRSLPLNVVNDQELIFLDDLAAAFQLSVREESLGTLTVAYKGRSILLTPEQPLVSIGGRLVSLPASPTRSGRRVMVPVEFISRALALIYDARLDLRKPARLLIAGDLRVPRVTVRVEGGDPTRVVVDASPRTASTVTQEGNSLAIRFDADLLDAALPPIQPQPLLQAIRLIEPVTLMLDLGPRFAGFRASAQQLEATTRTIIELAPAQTDQQPLAAVPAAPAAPSPPVVPLDLSALGTPVPSLRTIAIDPGHGGEDEGVKGAGGTKEKDLTLAVARRVKGLIESRLGIRVLMTREDDHNVSLDGRAAMANNNKADIFISLHANASFRKSAVGASVLYAAFDGDTVLAGRAAAPARLPTIGGGLREIDFVLWDLAQIRHVDRSGELAMLVADHFRERIPLSARPIDRAALRVLSSANMPAVMVEMGYLSNPEQEAKMSGAEFQNVLVQALYDAVIRFRDSLGGGTQ
ncbi:MAG: N-acetylmuramoyl-L-alanine amidase [Acidobacteriota bacterium]